MDDKKANYGFLITCAVTILGWGVTFGICQNKIENNTRQIARLEQQQSKSDSTLMIISNQLAGLNTKVDLLLDGRIVSAKDVNK